MSVGAVALSDRFSARASAPITFPLRVVHALVSAPTTIYLIAMTAMLFRPPDLKSLPVDRTAFLLLLAVIAARLCIFRERPRIHSASWPMLLLLFLGLWGVVAQPYEPEAWSLLAAKWIVPVTLFHIAGMVFDNEASLRKLELFSIVILTYLTAISILTLCDLKDLIYPRFILDESLGIHADRARGPFLQAVANGVCLNMLAIVALSSFARHRLPRFLGSILFLAVPFALLATRTRAVWLSAALSLAVLAVARTDARIRRVALALCIAGGLGFCATWLYQANSENLYERLEDRSPLEFRMEMYQSGLEMFGEKPWLGWGSDANVQPEIEKRISDFRPEHYLFHNTYLELAVQRGALGLGLYAWLMVCFFRLGRLRRTSASEERFLGGKFCVLWPLMLGVYLLNASAVVMNYQFVNGYLFTIAGILSAHVARQEYQGNKYAIAGARL